jgi:uncharacterized BrkB/YihY/UPF0761 family membrane protein
MDPPAAARRAWAGIRHRARRRWDALPGPVRTFLTWLRSPEFVTTSASLAFYALISLPPMVLLGFWVAGLFVDASALQDLGNAVGRQAPDEVPLASLLTTLVRVATRTGPVAAVAAIWPATTYGAALARAFTSIAPKAERRIRGWRGRLLALVLIAVLPLAVFTGLAALYVVPRLLGSGLALRVAVAIGALVVVLALIALIYVLFQLWDTRWDDVLIGAGSATAAVAVTSGGYLFYLRYTDLTARYGAVLATAVLLGLWLLLGNAALLAGYRLMSRRARRRVRGPAAAHREIKGPPPPP